jgi:hypothetical protein
MIIIGDERLHAEFLGYRDKCRQPIKVGLSDRAHVDELSQQQSRSAIPLMLACLVPMKCPTEK